MAKLYSHRSPLFYVGDKYKLITEIKTHFPQNINTFVEPFVGGGSVFMNVEAQNYILNDLDSHVISLHKFLCSFNRKTQKFFDTLFALIKQYGLSCSYLYDIVPQELKSQFVKTYYARFNKEAFNQLKSDFNKEHREDLFYLYTLLIYGFNRMLRFNRFGDYNLPVGNVDFNKNTFDALVDYFAITKDKQIRWKNFDFHRFFQRLQVTEQDLIYLDPPYLITFSEYNKYWNEETERDLLQILDTLNERHIRFAISNVTHYRGTVNRIFLEWSEQYNSYPIKSNYISYHDNTIKSFSEVLVTNY